jgi:succinyl-CoA synthetase beta subunit
MNLQEYQAKALLANAGIAVPRGRTATSPDDATAAAWEIGGPVVVKAQVLAGARGKAGGIRKAEEPEEAGAAAAAMLGKPLVTAQSGPKGYPVETVLVEEQVALEREFFLAFTIDRSAGCETVVASASGGMEVEEIAARDPKAILREAITPAAGIWPFQTREIATGLGLPARQIGPLHTLLARLLGIFRDRDCQLLEINPLALTADGRLVALDAKIGVDDHAAHRQRILTDTARRDITDPVEREAARIGVSYVHLDGNIGCVVNGAGLAMATVDILSHLGGRAANFLDVGGGADAEKVAAALRLILQDPAVKTILVNIFGGILRCDVFAQGFIQGVKLAGADLPMVVRLVGTNRDEGRRILAESDLRVIVEDELEAAAARAVAIAAGPREV